MPDRNTTPPIAPLPEPAPTARGPLGQLVDYISTHSPRHGTGITAQGMPVNTSAYPVVDMLDDIRATWSQLHADGQLRQSRAHVPDNAGPLNSNRLVHRSLILMQSLSPDYLRHFLSHVEQLSQLETLQAGKTATRDASPSGRKKPRS